MADRARSHRPRALSTHHYHGRLTSFDVAEAYRWGYRPDFACRWCGLPTEIPADGRGNVCRHCDLAEPWPA